MVVAGLGWASFDFFEYTPLDESSGSQPRGWVTR